VRFIFQFLVLIGSIAIFLSAKIPPDVVPIIALVCLLIPFVLLFNIFGLIFSISGGIKSYWGYAISLLLGSSFLISTLGFSISSNIEEGDFRVLSYNLHGLRPITKRGDKLEQQKMVDYILDHPANIKSLQEFYTHGRNPDMNVLARFKALGYHSYFEALTINDLDHDMGLAIFSRFPIINKGKIIENKPSLNNVIFADIVLDKTDTIRVYNAHFQSMGIDPNHVVETEQLKEEYHKVGLKFRGGAEIRTKQMREVMRHIDACRYPIIFTGDFNDTPYSYIYLSFNKRFDNAFEKKGRGFGFTMNSRLFFLRIDNVFVSEHFKVRAFRTHRDIPYSDHFPVEASLDFR
jgi:endonuclease/exonuclease/phosphatase family metal-dependent hydrolase